MPKQPLDPILHQNGMVTYWSVYHQRWLKGPASFLTDKELAAMPAHERSNVRRHRAYDTLNLKRIDVRNALEDTRDCATACVQGNAWVVICQPLDPPGPTTGGQQEMSYQEAMEAVRLERSYRALRQLGLVNDGEDFLVEAHDAAGSTLRELTDTWIVRIAESRGPLPTD